MSRRASVEWRRMHGAVTAVFSKVNELQCHVQLQGGGGGGGGAPSYSGIKFIPEVHVSRSARRTPTHLPATTADSLPADAADNHATSRRGPRSYGG